EVVEGDGNTLEVSGGSGRTVVVTASLTNSRSATARWKVAELQMNVPPGPNNGRYVITYEPRKPVITATVLGLGGTASISAWDVSVTFVANDCPPFGPPDRRTILRLSPTGGNECTPDFPENVIRGGSISFSATGIVNGCAVSAYGSAGL